MWLYALVWLILSACERPSDVSPPEVAHEAPNALPPIASVARAVREPLVISASARPVHDGTLRWIDADNRIYEVTNDPRKPVQLGDSKKLGDAWDDRYSYRTHCYANCDIEFPAGGSSHLIGIEREDPTTGASTRLNHGTVPASDIVLLGNYVYWISFAHACQGGVWRVPRKGGAQEELETSLTEWQPRYNGLRRYDEGLIAEDGHHVAWIPANGDAPRVVFPRHWAAWTDDRRHAIRDGDAFYLVNSRRDATYIAQGNVDGSERPIAGPLERVEELAALGDRLYFASAGALWTVAKAGGSPQRVVSTHCVPPDEVVGLWAKGFGLVWSCAMRYSVPPGTLYFAEWSNDD